MYIHICICIYVYRNAYTNIHINLCVYIYLYIQIYTYIYICKYTHIYIYLYVYTHIQVYRHMYVFTYTHTLQCRQQSRWLKTTAAGDWADAHSQKSALQSLCIVNLVARRLLRISCLLFKYIYTHIFTCIYKFYKKQTDLILILKTQLYWRSIQSIQ